MSTIVVAGASRGIGFVAALELDKELISFGVRVALIQPGIMDTRMAHNIERIGRSTTYPQVRRMTALCAAPFLACRSSLSDESWVQWGARSDEAWLRAVKNDFGWDPKL
jgi:NAD(P)-dependent dehydrogenase (short-subunit alcohol dehydrogenase family)